MFKRDLTPVACVLALLVAGLVQTAAANDAADQVKARIARELETLRAQGFALADQAPIEPTDRSAKRRFVVQLSQGITYALIGACDATCQHVELAIFDPDQQQLSRSTKRSDIAIFSGAPDRSGRYEVEVTLPGCRQASCSSGFAVLQQGGSPPTGGLIVAGGEAGTSDGAVAAVAGAMPAPAEPVTKAARPAADDDPAPSRAAAPKTTASITPGKPVSRPAAIGKPAQKTRLQTAAAGAKSAQRPAPPLRVNMERRFDTEIEGANYRRLVNVPMSICERSCVQDARCRAVEYYYGNQSCGLFDDQPSLRRARGIDASVKRILVR